MKAHVGCLSCLCGILARNPKLVGQLFLGGSICRGEAVKVLQDSELKVHGDFERSQSLK